MNKFDIKTGIGFPWQFKLVAIFLVAVAFMAIAKYPALSAILSFIAMLIFTARSGFEIDLDKKYFREYMAYFKVIRVGKPQSYEEIEYLYINSGTQSQQIYTAHTTSSSTFTHQLFNLFIKFSNGEKVKLLSSKNKNDLMNQANLIKSNFKTSLIDYTQES